MRMGPRTRRARRRVPTGGLNHEAVWFMTPDRPTRIRRPTLCFVAQSAYNVLGGDVEHIGGAEVQQVLLARQLASRGYDVSFVVYDHGQADRMNVDGLALFKSYRPDDGIRGLRFFYPRLWRLWAAMARADADIYYQRGAESETGLVARWCRRNRRKFVFALAGHHMIVPGGETRTSRHERILFRYGIARADLVLVQTGEQQTLVRDHCGLEARVLPNGCVLPDVEAPSSADASPERSGVLWVGRFSEIKRLEWCLKLAERMAHVHFDIVGSGSAHSDRVGRLEAHAARLPNVRLLGYLDSGRLRCRYRSARVLLCTSRSEGFPNVFLEAWSYGTPVLSTVDPDGLIRREELGWVADSEDGLADLLHRIQAAGSDWDRRSANCVRYVRREHDVRTVAGRLHTWLSALFEGDRAGHAFDAADHNEGVCVR